MRRVGRVVVAASVAAIAGCKFDIGSLQVPVTLPAATGGGYAPPSIQPGQVTSGAGQNRNPSVTSVAASPGGKLRPGYTIGLTAEANDPDGDQLMYTWTVPDGQLSTTSGKEVGWVLPMVPGTYTAKVIVNDGKGGSATAAQAVEVVNPDAPVPGGGQAHRLRYNRSSHRTWSTSPTRCLWVLNSD